MPKQLPLFSDGWMQVFESLPEETKDRATSELKDLVMEYFKMRTNREPANDK